MHPSVFALARRKGIRIVLIPAGLTGLLQPLDTHVFRQFRARMQHWWLESKSSASDGAVSLLAWLGLVRRSIDDIVLAKDWHHAFEQTGVLRSIQFGDFVQQCLLWEAIKDNRKKTKAAQRRKKRLVQAAGQLTGDDLKLLVAAKEKEDKEKAEAKAQEDKEEEKDKEDEAK
eukprot:symbB.v1.2.040893.t1/scaffold7627.1/size29405/2